MAASTAMTSANVTSGRAVADIKALYFLKHVNGAEPTVNADLMAQAGWFAVATIRGSVNITQEAVQTEKINIDQSNMPIGITTEPGDFTFEAVLASLAADDLGKWFTKDSTALEFKTAGSKPVTLKGYGYTIDGELVQCAVLVETRTGDGFLFPNCQVSAAINKDDKVFGINISGMVLGSNNAANKDVYILTDHTAGPA